MKLLVVSHSCATAANQRLHAEIKAQTGWDVTLVIPARWKDEFGNQLDERPEIEPASAVRKVPTFVNGNIILHAYRLNWGRFLREEKFDAIYVNHEPYALATAQICFANSRQKIPAAFGFYSCQNIVKTYPFPFSKMERMVYGQSRFAFPITEAVADVLRAKEYAGPIQVCPLPVDLRHYFPRTEEENLRLLPREADEVVIGYVGRIVESKGLRTLAQALNKISDLRWKLVLIGTGDFQEEFSTLLNGYGLGNRATFSGYVPHNDVPPFLSAFDLLVLPSETQANWKEQFGRVLLEAMACGTPVLGSDSGEIPVLIEASGGGRVFPERNVEALAASLRGLLTNAAARQRLSEQGREWTRNHVSLPATAAKMVTAIKEAIAQ